MSFSGFAGRTCDQRRNEIAAGNNAGAFPDGLSRSREQFNARPLDPARIFGNSKCLEKTSGELSKVIWQCFQRDANPKQTVCCRAPSAFDNERDGEYSKSVLLFQILFFKKKDKMNLLRKKKTLKTSRFKFWTPKFTLNWSFKRKFQQICCLSVQFTFADQRPIFSI